MYTRQYKWIAPTYSYHLNGEQNDMARHFMVAPAGSGRARVQRFHVAVAQCALHGNGVVSMWGLVYGRDEHHYQHGPPAPGGGNDV
jgi:hypothetical protein